MSLARAAREIRRVSLDLPRDHPDQDRLFAAHDALFNPKAAPAHQVGVGHSREREAAKRLGREQA